MRSEDILPLGVNWLWMQSCRADHGRFIASLEKPQLAQQRYLMDLLKRNVATQYGRAGHFSRISCVQDFQKTLPLTKYEDYLPYLEQIAQGRPSVLTDDSVILFQPTSGTSSASKLIPYTRRLRAEYQRSVAPWIRSLYLRVPSLMKGKAYWSISPPAARKQYYGCIPVGFDDDSEYLGPIGRRLHGMVSAARRRFASGTPTDEFWDLTLVSLVCTRNLTLISVWSPTFLLTMIKHFERHWARILEELADSGLPHADSRAKVCRRMVEKQGLKLQAIWPDLRIISCWTHGASEPYIAEIRRYFPDVEIQGKGLIATEAFVSLPLFPDKDPVLAVNSHFFEFREVDSGRILLAHELRQDAVYSVIVTTGGGLYRYELNDLVRVTGYVAATPAIRFVSRKMVTDLFGEKLNVEHVQSSVATAFSESTLVPTFYLVAPTSLDEQVSYTLFFQTPSISPAQALTLRERLENLLLQNFHYAHCRELGQLGRLRLYHIEGLAAAPEGSYVEEMRRRGQKLGDIKPPVLDQGMGWEKRFSGRFL